MEYIQINNYFFEPTSVGGGGIEEIGETRRNPWTGTVNTQITTRYKPFSYTFDNISPAQLGHFLYLNSLCKPLEGSEPQNLTLTDLSGDIYEVIIPINGLDYKPEPGEEETYEVKLTLETVGEV